MNEHPFRFHLSLKVSHQNFEDTVKFYTMVFGGEPVKKKPGYAKFEPVEPYVNFTLNAVEKHDTGEIDHLGIQVFSDENLLAARERITKLGLHVRDEQEVACCYATQNKFWVTDPEGRNIEFFHKLADIEQHGKRLLTVNQNTSACCAPAVTKGNDACCSPQEKTETGSSTGCC